MTGIVRVEWRGKGFPARSAVPSRYSDASVGGDLTGTISMRRRRPVESYVESAVD